MRSMRAARQMLKYLRSVFMSPPPAWRQVSNLPLPERQVGNLPPRRRARSSWRCLLRHGALLEHQRDHLIERRVLHAHVNDRVAVEQGRQHLGDAAAVNLQVERGAGLAGDLTEALPVVLG